MGNKLNSKDRKKVLVLVFVIGCVTTVLAIKLYVEKEKPAQASLAKDIPSFSSDKKIETAATTENDNRKLKIERFRQLKDTLEQQAALSKRVDATDNERSQPASDETQKIRPSTHYERRTTRELIVLDGVFGMINNGENEKAISFLAQQRTLFPEETPVENEAFSVIHGCIEARNDKSRKAASDFVQTHPDFRLNKHINRICID